ncbi:multiple sugar transport system permease protein [Anaerotaenia torta]|uniref:carbohydrate ABC transporter permease n=1 Tax=Anaerotaenia torta TaxID=433293 RepID=UPI003D1B6A6A
MDTLSKYLKQVDQKKVKDEMIHYVRVKKPQRKLWAVVRHILLIGISFIILYPILFMISNAFKPVEQYYDPSVIWIPKGITLKNFSVVLMVIDFGKVLTNTVLISLLPALIQTCVCMYVAYGLARFQFKGRKLIVAMVILTVIVPQQTISTSLYASYRSMDLLGIVGWLSQITGGAIKVPNLIGTPWVTILPSLLAVGFKGGLYIFIFLQFFTGLPKELQEAASIDGCGAIRTFLKIIVPTTKNITLSVVLLSVVWNWNDYYTPAMFIRTRDTISTAMAGFQTQLENLHNLGIGAENIQTANTQIQAACLMSIIPLVILYIILQKYFTEGIESSGLTGL